MNVVNESGLLMFYVYILQSINFPEHFYVGCTNDLKRRLKEHNNGNSVSDNFFIKFLPSEAENISLIFSIISAVIYIVAFVYAMIALGNATKDTDLSSVKETKKQLLNLIIRI